MAFNFLSTLYFLFCLLSFTSSIRTPPINRTLVHTLSGSSEKVSIDVYYESLSPESITFITDFLPLIFQSGLISIVDLHFSPWGNAWILDDGTIECQHGEDECILNTIEACVIETWPEPEEHFGFISCLELMVGNNMSDKSLMTCFALASLDKIQNLFQCYSSGLGMKLALKYAKETDALKPRLEYTPWVVVDGKPLDEDVKNFMNYICEAYKSSSTPVACQYLSSVTVPSNTSSKRHQFSFRANGEEPRSAPINS